MNVDRFGNPHAPNLSYAHGAILSSTEDDFQKLQRAWSLIRERGPDKIYVFTGLEHSLPLAAEELALADDEIAPALCFGRLKTLALEHLGGSPETDDVAVFNRLTGATMATHLTLVKPGDVVIGVSASHKAPSSWPRAGLAGAELVE
jgi:seryl-tRNA(Sec) selenium transferase